MGDRGSGRGLVTRGVAERWRRLRYDPQRREWLPAGLAGGLSGGAGIAWLLWGWPNLLGRDLCFLLWLALGIGIAVLGCAGGVGFVVLVQRLLETLRRLRTSPAAALWEPVEPDTEADLEVVSGPGCAIALYLPVISVSGAVAGALVYLAFRQVAFWRVIVMAVLGLPLGIAMARAEVRGGQGSRPRMPLR